MISDSILHSEKDTLEPKLGRADDEMKEIENIDFHEIERMIKKSLRDSDNHDYSLPNQNLKEHLEEGEAILTTEYINFDRADSDYFRIPVACKI